MNRQRLKYGGCKRPKAAFGESIAAAGITAAATLAAAKMGVDATTRAARQQADATLKQAQENANSLRLQNENSNRLQQESIEFTREQNEQNRKLQQDVQLTLQMMAGQESMKDRREASKIQVRNGGGTNRRKLRNVGAIPSLRGSNIPFNVTDGGGVIPIGITPEGFNLYELYGNDHEHYHKVRSGKAKTGVGIKFANGATIEGEGNQNSNKGELLLTTPEGGYFISKHSINGFNPAQAVFNGMNPVDAFNMQELIKDMTGISDDGKHNSTPVKKRKLRLAGGNINNNLLQPVNQGLDFSTDTILPSAIGIGYGFQNQQEENNTAKFGKKVRCLKNGGRVKYWPGGNPYLRNAEFVYDGPSYIMTPTGSSKSTSSSSRLSTWLNNNSQLVGAGIGALGNIGGALISQWGNNKAAGILSDAYSQAGNILADAYRNMRGIDLGAISKENYAAAHVMPAIRSAYYNINPQLTEVNRQKDRLASSIKRNSLSSAAMLNRLGKIEVDAADARNRLYAEKANKEEIMHQANNEAINKAAIVNAQLDAEANREWASDYMQGMMYNADIDNAKITQSAGALANAMTLGANARSSALTSNANAWASALTGSAGGFANVFATRAKERADINNVILGSDNVAAGRYYASLPENDSRRINFINTMKRAANSSTGKTRDEYLGILSMFGII